MNAGSIATRRTTAEICMAILKIRNEQRGRFEFTVHLHLSYNKKHSIKYKILFIIAILHILTCKCADKPNPHCLLSFSSKCKAGACHCAMHWGNAPQPSIMPLARAGRQPSYSEKNPPHLAFKSCVLTESFHKYWYISQYEQTRQDRTQVRAPSCITCCSGPLFFPRPCWPSRATLSSDRDAIAGHITTVLFSGVREGLHSMVDVVPTYSLLLCLQVALVCCHTNGLFTGSMFL